MLHSIIEMEEIAIRHSFTGSHQISGGKLKSVSQSIVLLYGSYFLISKNQFSDIRKYKSFFYIKNHFQISRIRIYVSQNYISDIEKWNNWYQKMIFWYQKIQVYDIKKYRFNNNCESDRMYNRLVVSGQLSDSDWLSNKTQQFIKQLLCNLCKRPN